ncbi:MAG: NAD(P)H-hydrate dehydratase [Gammaproteobacteria bacterium]|nr:MAG: NAD(P)H-hydrate dehydratase [Gammaproteobacteria bacterium]
MERHGGLYTASQTRELDRRAIEEAGIPGWTLMQRAGRAAWDLAVERWPDAQRLLVVCGPGNNGGDGYVVARLAREAGREVYLLQAGDPDRIRGEAAIARQAWLDAGGHEHAPDAELPEAELIIDALLGTGLERPLEGVFLDLVRAINAHPAPVLAVDIPSGLNADSGAVLGDAVQADATLSFIGRKRGLHTGPALDLCGVLAFDDLAVPDSVYRAVAPSARLLDGSELLRLGRRPRNSHKGDFGHLLIIGGQPGMPGAVLMAAHAALRCGSGRVTLATHPRHADLLPLALPEVMTHACSEPADLLPLLEQADVVLLGPGLGTGDWSRRLFDAALQFPGPMVIDADGLNLLAHSTRSPGNWVLTPHPGEAARLLGIQSADIQNDRFEAAQRLCRLHAPVVVLKGAGSIVCSGDGALAVCPHGNPGMATAGMGDVLGGVIASLIGQGLAPDVAARAGVWLHALAGDTMAGAHPRGLMATDLLPALRVGVNEWPE